jgi:hypothetical protein
MVISAQRAKQGRPLLSPSSIFHASAGSVSHLSAAASSSGSGSFAHLPQQFGKANETRGDSNPINSNELHGFALLPRFRAPSLRAAAHMYDWPRNFLS